jgi:tRNA threonylcarbamoyladenosine biosynthesis protein TsaE
MYVLKLRSNNLNDTEHIGAVVGAHMPAGGTLALCGPLAAGKTAISRAIFAARGFYAHFCSPSYTIINEYTADGKIAYHMDVYRLSDESELDETGYGDCLQTGELNVIEWADRIAEHLPEDTFFIDISPVAGDANARILAMKTDDEILYKALREALDAYTCD